MIIDFHTHIFPDAIAPKALSKLTYAIRTGGYDFEPDAPYTLATADSLAASSAAAGIDISVVMPIATSPHPSQTINSFAAAVNKRRGLRSFGSVHPQNPDALTELERICALGLKGIKLHPEYQSCYVDEPETVAVVRKASELGLWVLFHAGVDVGIKPPVHGTPERFARLRQAVPDAPIILAHMGGFSLWQEVEQIFPGLGFYVDTSTSLSAFPGEWDRFARIIRALGTDHVLFATDSPWADQATSLRVTNKFLSTYDFSEDEQKAILGGNAAKILSL